MHPDTALSWGYDDGEDHDGDEIHCIPSEKNGYAGIPASLVEDFRKELKWLCSVLRQCFQKAGQGEFFERVFQNFQCGILGDETDSHIGGPSWASGVLGSCINEQAVG